MIDCRRVRELAGDGPRQAATPDVEMDNTPSDRPSALAKFLDEIEPDLKRLEIVRAGLTAEGRGPGERPEWGFVFFPASEHWKAHVWKWPGDYDRLRARAAEILERAQVHHTIMRGRRRTRGRVGPEKEELSRRLARALDILGEFLTSG